MLALCTGDDADGLANEEREEDEEATELSPNKQGTAASRVTTASAVKRNNAALQKKVEEE